MSAENVDIGLAALSQEKTMIAMAMINNLDNDDDDDDDDDDDNDDDDDGDADNDDDAAIDWPSLSASR